MALRTYAVLGISAVVAAIVIALLFTSESDPGHERPKFIFPYWTEGRPMPTPRTEIAGAAIGMNVYIIGGFDASGRAVSTVELYASTNAIWGTAAPLPQPLHHAAAASYDGKLYVIGGYFADGKASDKLFEYEPVMNKWKVLAPMPSARGALTANFVNGTLYAVGGAPGNFGAMTHPLFLNEAYDPATDEWTAKEGMPTPRQHLASVVFGDRLYVIGGRTEGLSSNLDATEVYDPAKDEWTVLAPMPSKRGGLAAAMSGTDGWIYVFGGEAPDGTFRNNERYDPYGDEWEKAPEMPNGRHGLAAVDIGSEIYVIGGGPQPGLTVSDLNQILHTAYMLQ